MPEPSTLSQILAIIKKEYDIEPSSIDPARPLAEFGLDSLALAELIFAIEDHFHFEYPESRTNVQTLNELVQVVDESRPVAASA